LVAFLTFNLSNKRSQHDAVLIQVCSTSNNIQQGMIFLTDTGPTSCHVDRYLSATRCKDPFVVVTTFITAWFRACYKAFVVIHYPAASRQSTNSLLLLSMSPPLWLYLIVHSALTGPTRSSGPQVLRSSLQTNRTCLCGIMSIQYNIKLRPMRCRQLDMFSRIPYCLILACTNVAASGIVLAQKAK
jgi:hypothetical protein